LGTIVASRIEILVEIPTHDTTESIRKCLLELGYYIGCIRPIQPSIAVAISIAACRRTIAYWKTHNHHYRRRVHRNLSVIVELLLRRTINRTTICAALIVELDIEPRDKWANCLIYICVRGSVVVVVRVSLRPVWGLWGMGNDVVRKSQIHIQV
jgi:hypothetical protein